MEAVYRKQVASQLPFKHIGSASELIAAAYLLEQGYEVFRNVSTRGPVDLVAWDPATGELLKLDVTTGTYKYTHGGTECSLWFNKGGNKARNAEEYDVIPVVVAPDGRVFINPPQSMKVVCSTRAS